MVKWRWDCVAINYVGGEQQKTINTMIFVLVCDSIEFRVTILAVFLKIGFSVKHGLLFPYCAEEQFFNKEVRRRGRVCFHKKSNHLQK